MKKVSFSKDTKDTTDATSTANADKTPAAKTPATKKSATKSKQKSLPVKEVKPNTRCTKKLGSGKRCKNPLKNNDLCDIHLKAQKRVEKEKSLELNQPEKLTDQTDETDQANQTDKILLEKKVSKMVTEKVIPKLAVAKNVVFPETSEKKFDERVLRLMEINKSMPEQRTPPWYQFRSERLTASDAAKALLLTNYELDLNDKEIIHIEVKTPKLGSSCHSGKSIIKDLYIAKCGEQKPHKQLNSPAILHGVCYEIVGSTIYETRENEKVINFGLMPHPTIKFLGASPDGITAHSGRMLEIKIPFSREIIGIPIIYYWIQMQVQLQCCQLDVCDFVECTIKEYKNEEEYLGDSLVEFDSNESESIVYNRTSDNLEKGCVICVDYLKDLPNCSDTRYCSPLTLKSHAEMKKWISDKLIEIASENDGVNAEHFILNDGAVSVVIKWWYLVKYSKVEVKRDDVWWEKRLPDFQRFWNNVEKFRREGLPESCQSKVKAKEESMAASSVRSNGDCGGGGGGGDAESSYPSYQKFNSVTDLTQKKYMIVDDNDSCVTNTSRVITTTKDSPETKSEVANTNVKPQKKTATKQSTLKNFMISNDSE